MSRHLASSILDAVAASTNRKILYASPAEDLQGTSAEELAEIEQTLGAPLPPEVKEFYLGARQLLLVWQYDVGTRTFANPESWSGICDTDSEFWQDHLRESRDFKRRGGMICIPPARDVFLRAEGEELPSEPYDEEIDIDREPFLDRDVYENLYVFEYVTTYYLAGLWLNRETNTWRVLLGGDHGACWTDYSTLSVTEYFEQLRSTLGESRRFRLRRGDDRDCVPLRAED